MSHDGSSEMIKAPLNYSKNFKAELQSTLTPTLMVAPMEGDSAPTRMSPPPPPQLVTQSVTDLLRALLKSVPGRLSCTLWLELDNCILPVPGRLTDTWTVIECS